MNKKNLESREVRLGLIHVAGLLGLTVGCIAAAFCLGYLAGSKVGFERESSTILAELPKFPVGEGGGEDVGEKIANEVYAKLNEPTVSAEIPPPTGLDAPAEDVPELTSIPDVKTQDQPDATNESAAPTEKTDSPVAVIDTSKPPAEEVKPPSDDQAVIKVLGDLQGKDTAGEKGGESPNIGSLVTGKGDGAKAAVSTAKPVPTAAEKIPPAVSKGVADATVTKKVPPGWFAQVAAPRKVEDANQLAASLKKSGFAVTIEAAQVRGEDYFRVLVGPEGSKDQAQILLQQLKREPYLKGEPFIRMVK